MATTQSIPPEYEVVSTKDDTGRDSGSGVLVDRDAAAKGNDPYFIEFENGCRVYGKTSENVVNNMKNVIMNKCIGSHTKMKDANDDDGIGVLVDKTRGVKGTNPYFIEFTNGCRVYGNSLRDAVSSIKEVDVDKCGKKGNNASRKGQESKPKQKTLTVGDQIRAMEAAKKLKGVKKPRVAFMRSVPQNPKAKGGGKTFKSFQRAKTHRNISKSSSRKKFKR
jgi:hypothetical protein